MTPGIYNNELLVVSQKGTFLRIDPESGNIKSSLRQRLCSRLSTMLQSQAEGRTLTEEKERLSVLIYQTIQLNGQNHLFRVKQL